MTKSEILIMIGIVWPVACDKGKHSKLVSKQRKLNLRIHEAEGGRQKSRVRRRRRRRRRILYLSTVVSSGISIIIRREGRKVREWRGEEGKRGLNNCTD